jgi:predicted esterase
MKTRISQVETPRRLHLAAAAFAGVLALHMPDASALESLKSYNVKLDETSVSGISSGAFMAVQFGVAHSAIVKGVGATAGGPYFCAETLLNQHMNTRILLSRCMQGDPAFPAIPITPADLDRLIGETEAMADRGDIDPTAHLADQKVWLFHGYNDGLVKQAVSDALYSFYAHYTPTKVFYKDNLPAGHAQVIDYCPQALSNCDCSRTGDEYIKNCAYDSAGKILQHIYGELKPKASRLEGNFVEFAQDEFARDLIGKEGANAISMAGTGYAYIPKSCAAQQPCRVHVALHGCEQYAGKIGDAFLKSAGYNEWADTNDIIVLYPQTTSSYARLGVVNPMGCWDWWGYNQITDSTGNYVTKKGLQISTIKRMLDRLAGGYSGWSSLPTAGPLTASDLTHRQVALHWGAVADSAGANIYRSGSKSGPYARLNAAAPVLGNVYVDATLKPSRTYFYVIKSADATGREVAVSNPLRVTTARRPPPCDPYFSLSQNRSVNREGKTSDLKCR